VPGDHQQVVGLDVELLQLEMRRHVFERIGGVSQVADQLLARTAG
jgi:hypothetical protein